MVNGFFGLALATKSETEKASEIVNKINEINSKNDFSFYENFNTNTLEPNGVSLCAWSAGATVLMHHVLATNFKILV